MTEETVKSEYKTLARKYRPQFLKDLLGQEVLVNTIATAIRLNKLSNGYLLSGIRGVGKTTTARIIARTINCTNLSYENNIPKPCFQCQNCKEISNESHPDLIEVDAASKTGVSDVREIIENANYRPLLGKYKVYIIDEVHMLSINAFNALLKTLEEPPEHVIFILATTEIRKVPITIMSRCQRFQLKRFSKQESIDHLKLIARNEGVTIDEDAFAIIADKSEGSARDALSLLNQVIIFSDNGKNITLDFVQEILGMADKKSIFELFKYIMEGNVTKSISIIHNHYYQGIQLSGIIDDLSAMLADFLKYKTTGEIYNPSYISSEYQEFISTNAHNAEIQSLLYLWQILVKGRNEIQKSANQLSTCEILIIKACYIYDNRKISYEEQAFQPSKTEEINVKLSENISKDYEEFIDKFRASGEMILYHALYHDLIPIKFSGDHLSLGSKNPISKTLLNEIKNCYKNITGLDITIDFNIVMEGTSLKEQKDATKQKAIEEISNHDEVQKILDVFSEAKVISVE